MRANLFENNIRRVFDPVSQSLKLTCLKHAQRPVQRLCELETGGLIRLQIDGIQRMHGIRRDACLGEAVSDERLKLFGRAVACATNAQRDLLRVKAQLRLRGGDAAGDRDAAPQPALRPHLLG